MVYVLGQLKVENFGKWKSTFDGVSAQRKEAGSKEALVFSNSTDQNEVVILFNGTTWKMHRSISNQTF